MITVNTISALCRVHPNTHTHTYIQREEGEERVRRRRYLKR